MDEITELAQRLGKAINASPQAAVLRQAREAVNSDAGLSQTLKDYQAQMEKVARLEQEEKPVEVEDKHRLQALQDKLLGSEEFKKFSAAQVEYVDLMRKVNEALREQLMPTEID